jgi:hypothetical protein
MVTSAFYPQIFINYWMWSIMMLAFVAATLSQRLVSDVSDARRAQTWRDADQAEKKVLAK